MKKFAALMALAAFATVGFAADAPKQAKDEEGWIRLFNPEKGLEGWKANEVPEAWLVEGDSIVSIGHRSHLFYIGPVEKADFKNFEFRCEVKTTPGANSGIFFHTKMQPNGWPGNGYEAQVNSTHSDPIRTGSLYNVVNVKHPTASEHSKDGEWCKYYIKVQGKTIVIKINDKETVNYTEPENLEPPKERQGRRLSSGTFAFQAHPPLQGVPVEKARVYFRNVMAKPLP